MNESNFSTRREQMVRQQIEARGIEDERVLDAMLAVPRHLFVLPENQRHAYSDRPLSIGEDQTISQPYIVALMTQYLRLAGDERVLEVGAGSGYQAAVLSMLAKEVHTVERIPSLARRAAHILDELGYANVTVHLGDGSLGWPADAPYDAIIVAAAAPEAPQPLLDQLADGGRLVLPVGEQYTQYLQLWKRSGSQLDHDLMMPVSFVPLRGELGWTAGSDDEDDA